MTQTKYFFIFLILMLNLQAMEDLHSESSSSFASAQPEEDQSEPERSPYQEALLAINTNFKTVLQALEEEQHDTLEVPLGKIHRGFDDLDPMFRSLAQETTIHSGFLTKIFQVTRNIRHHLTMAQEAVRNGGDIQAAVRQAHEEKASLFRALREIRPYEPSLMEQLAQGTTRRIQEGLIDPTEDRLDPLQDSPTHVATHLARQYANPLLTMALDSGRRLLQSFHSSRAREKSSTPLLEEIQHYTEPREKEDEDDSQSETEDLSESEDEEAGPSSNPNGLGMLARGARWVSEQTQQRAPELASSLRSPSEQKQFQKKADFLLNPPAKPLSLKLAQWRERKTAEEKARKENPDEEKKDETSLLSRGASWVALRLVNGATSLFASPETQEQLACPDVQEALRDPLRPSTFAELSTDIGEAIGITSQDRRRAQRMVHRHLTRPRFEQAAHLVERGAPWIEIGAHQLQTLSDQQEAAAKDEDLILQALRELGEDDEKASRELSRSPSP